MKVVKELQCARLLKKHRARTTPDLVQRLLRV